VDSFEDKRRGGFSFPASLLRLGVQEEDDSGSAWAAAGPRWVATRAKEKPRRATRFGWGRPLQLGRAGVRGRGGCWAGLGFRPGFCPESVLLFKIPFLFPYLFIICKLI
jgi:hypothetical protein